MASCTCRGCCVFPNGPIGILAIILSVIAFVLGNFANDFCYYVQVDVREAFELDWPALQNYDIGLWNRRQVARSECVEFSTNDVFDATWKAARAMAIMACAFGGVAMIIAICLSCVSIPRKWLWEIAFSSACAGLFQGLTLIALSSDVCKEFNCKFSSGAACAVVATVFYLFNACLVLRIPEYEEPPEEEKEPAAAPGTVTVTETTLPDGTKKTIKTTVNPDGSKTVVETVETKTPVPAAEDSGGTTNEPEQATS